MLRDITDIASIVFEVSFLVATVYIAVLLSKRK